MRVVTVRRAVTGNLDKFIQARTDRTVGTLTQACTHTHARAHAHTHADTRTRSNSHGSLRAATMQALDADVAAVLTAKVSPGADVACFRSSSGLRASPGADVAGCSVSFAQCAAVDALKQTSASPSASADQIKGAIDAAAQRIAQRFGNQVGAHLFVQKQHSAPTMRHLVQRTMRCSTECSMQRTRRRCFATDCRRRLRARHCCSRRSRVR